MMTSLEYLDYQIKGFNVFDGWDELLKSANQHPDNRPEWQKRKEKDCTPSPEKRRALRKKRNKS